MGQQQLSLIILVTIVVGISAVLAVNTFQQSHENSNLDAIRLDIYHAHSQSRAYYTKTKLMGGGAGSFSDIQLRDILLNAENDNAKYEILETTDENFTLSYIPHSRNAEFAVVISYDGILWENLVEVDP